VDKKYQVFVSSTYADLQEERRHVMQALLELDHIPAGMELFPAADEDQWSLIKEVIDTCDYYIVVVAGKYGSQGPDGMGYTEKEYRYAIGQAKPVIAFLHKDPDSLPGTKLETDPELRNRLHAFRELTKQKMCKFWCTADELGSVVSRSLVKLIKAHPGVGWVRANEFPIEATEEILRLRRKVEELEARIAQVSMTPPPQTEHLAQGDDSFTIRILRKDNNNQVSEIPFSTTWNELFSCIGPMMLSIRVSSELSESICELAQRRMAKLRDARGLRVVEQDLQTITLQLRALGLIRQDTPNALLWRLTEYGDQVVTRLRAVCRVTDAPKGNDEG